MAGSFGELLWQLSGHGDPTAAMTAAMLNGQGGQATPAGAGTAGGAAVAGGTPQPQAYTSPPDLMKLYGELTQQQQFADSINTGTALILSGFAAPENKDNIMQAFGVGGGGSGDSSGGSLDYLSNIMKFQQAQAEQARLAANRARIPAMAKQYGLDIDTATYLFDTGKLDSVISELEKPNVEVVKLEDGTSVLVDKNDGSVGVPFGVAKKREMEIIKNDNTGEQFAVYKDTKERVGGDPLVKGTRKMEYQEQADGSKKLVYADDKSDVPGEDRDIAAPPRKITFQEDGKGGRIAMYEDGTRVPDKDIAGMGSTEKEQLYNAAKIDAEKRGVTDFPSLDTWVKDLTERGSTKVNLGPSGIDYGNPPTDMAWKRDAEGKVMVDENGAPMAVPIKGTKLYNEKAEGDEASAKNDINKAVSSTIVGQDIDRAIANIDANKDAWIGSTGWGSLFGSWIPESEAMQLHDLTNTIKSNVGMDKLQAMRAASPTGAALGPVSDFENKLLQATIGNLNLQGKAEDIKYNLRRVKVVYEAIINDGVKDQAEAERLLSAVPYDEPEETLPEPETPESIEDILKRNKGE